MSRPISALTLSLAACAMPMAASAAGAAAVAPKAVSIDQKNSLLDFHLGWPAEVSAVPALVRLIRGPALAHKAELLKAAASDKAQRAKDSYPFNAYEYSDQYNLEGNSARLLSLSEDISEFSGGAHPNHGTKAVLWDRQAGKRIAFTDLLAGGGSKLDGLFKSAYCKGLNKERAEKRGPEAAAEMAKLPNDPFNQCPKWSELALIPKGKSGQPMTAILIHADPYVAGPYVEGDYDVELPVTRAFIAALKPAYRSSFAAR